MLSIIAAESVKGFSFIKFGKAANMALKDDKANDRQANPVLFCAVIN
jgi:hypothetical protein